uniref:Uncharacterized protein n=1 Tax=Tanacetum cinerariifolium TaxID=118510 RepID=A0A699ITY0_TANCI|nr:hypothetical protein [Tanacetum cinerariifolium]
MGSDDEGFSVGWRVPVGFPARKRIRLKQDKSEQNRIKTGQKWEGWQSLEKSRAVSVDRARKTEENAKRMVENACTYQKLFNFKRKEEIKGPELKFFQTTTTWT